MTQPPGVRAESPLPMEFLSAEQGPQGDADDLRGRIGGRRMVPAGLPPRVQRTQAGSLIAERIPFLWGHLPGARPGSAGCGLQTIKHIGHSRQAGERRRIKAEGRHSASGPFGQTPVLPADRICRVPLRQWPLRAHSQIPGRRNTAPCAPGPAGPPGAAAGPPPPAGSAPHPEVSSGRATRDPSRPAPPPYTSVSAPSMEEIQRAVSRSLTLKACTIPALERNVPAAFP